MDCQHVHFVNYSCYLHYRSRKQYEVPRYKIAVFVSLCSNTQFIAIDSLLYSCYIFLDYLNEVHAWNNTYLVETTCKRLVVVHHSAVNKTIYSSIACWILEYPNIIVKLKCRQLIMNFSFDFSLMPSRCRREPVLLWDVLTAHTNSQNGNGNIVLPMGYTTVTRLVIVSRHSSSLPSQQLQSQHCDRIGWIISIERRLLIGLLLKG